MYRFSKGNVLFGCVLVALTLSVLFTMASAAHAHEFWIVPLGYADDTVKSNIGYSHDYPACEPIPDDRIQIFEPLKLVTPKGAVTLDQVGENYAYQKKMALQKGSYPVIGQYRPTFWSNGPDGWAQKDRKQRPDAAYVEEAIMCAKSILNVQGTEDDSLATKPVGQRLEIVPMINPARAKADGNLPVKVLCDGKPVDGVEVTATFDRFADKKQPAFKGKADAAGAVSIGPLKPGFWMVRVRHAFEHPDKTRADEVVIVSTLTFQIDG